MRNIEILLLVMSVSLSGCDSDGNDDPTSFSGKVVYSGNQEPFVGEIIIGGSKDDFPGDRAIVTKRQAVEEDGSYRLSFEGDEEIDYFFINPSVEVQVGENSPIIDVDCGGLDCSRIAPGRDYENFIISLDRSN